MDYWYLPHCMGYTGYYRQKVASIMLELIDYTEDGRRSTHYELKWEIPVSIL